MEAGAKLYFTRTRECEQETKRNANNRNSHMNCSARKNASQKMLAIFLAQCTTSLLGHSDASYKKSRGEVSVNTRYFLEHLIFP